MFLFDRTPSAQLVCRGCDLTVEGMHFKKEILEVKPSSNGLFKSNVFFAAARADMMRLAAGCMIQTWLNDFKRRSIVSVDHMMAHSQDCCHCSNVSIPAFGLL